MQKHILIVDDNEDNINILSNTFEVIMTHKVTVAHNGIEAIRLANETPFDVVLLNVHSPTLRGQDIMDALKQLKNYRDTPIVSITSVQQRFTNTPQCWDEEP